MKKLSQMRGGLLPISLLLAVAGVGCGDDNGGMVDMGRDLGQPDVGQPDLGPVEDMGPEDMGFDAGPQLADPQVRVVHSVSDLTTDRDGPVLPIKGIRLCIDTGFTIIAQPANADLLPELGINLEDGLPHRAVTPYLDTLPTSTVRVYDEFVVDNDDPGALPPAVTCPSTFVDENDCTGEATPCLFQFEYDPSTLTDGEYYSLIIQGFSDNTNTCLDGSMQPIACPTGDISATLHQDEDADDIVAGSTRVRFVHNIHNLFAADLCYDADGLAGVGAAPTLIHADVAPGSVSPYATVPALTAAEGFVFLTLKTGDPLADGDCAVTFGLDLMPNNVVPVFFSAANAMTGDTTPGLVAGTVLTIFATGDTRFLDQPAGDPGTNPIEWANYGARTPIPLAFFDVPPPAP